MPRKFLAEMEIENLMKDLEQENFDDSDSENEVEFEISIFENNEVDFDVSANFDQKVKSLFAWKEVEGSEVIRILPFSVKVGLKVDASNFKMTRSTIRSDVGVAIVSQTISRHLAEANLKSKRPFRALPLTPEHQQLRLQWCQARLMWNVTDWQKVVFSDESWSVLGTDDNRVRVWRRPGEWYNSSHTVLRHTAHTAGVMVWGAITYDSWSTLIVMRGTLTGQHYVDDILRPHVGLFLNGLPGAIFQQDNARPHTARVAQDFLCHFQTLPWPAHSPDLSPVEHVWDQLKCQMPSCHSVHDLELAVQDLWARLPQDNIRCLINSMLDRVAACIAAGAIQQNDHQARRRFVEWAQNEIAVDPDFHKRILFRDEAHFWLNGYVNKQNCRIWSEANPQVYVETPLHPEKLTVWCALWAGGIFLQKR
ncbi:transposable element Tc1 transposase [Trichonephila clavipes]|nr:transposable element Tc1 transposase [Trichonephila clavipes]